MVDPVVADYIVEGLLVANCKPAPARLDDLLRLCTRALLDGKLDLEVRGKRAAALLDGTGTARFLQLRHSVFSSENGFDNSWVSLSIAPSESHERAILGVGVHLGKLGDQVGVEWDAGLQIARRLTQLKVFELAFLSGRPVDVERAALPSEKSYAHRDIPTVFAAWTFIGGGRTQGASPPVPAKLTAHSAGPWSGGLEVQAVKHLLDSPPKSFVEQLSSGWSASFMPPLR